MPSSLRRLTLGVALILAAAAVLLLSDLRSRKSASTLPSSPAPQGRTARVALLQHASQAVLDQGREGLLAGIREKGWFPGTNLDLRLFNAEGDMAVAQTIARQMCADDHDLLLTISTVSLQAVANANQAARRKHVFALVSDPASAGVGIHRDDPLNHPAHLAGYGTMQPIAEAFALAREMNPALARVGVVWNAAEANSEAQVKLARTVCAGLGIELLESTVDNSAGVAEAASALVARGVEALWAGGDVTVLTAADSLIAAARKGRIPVFTVIPPHVRRGALFDLGADYFEVGRLAGNLAGEVLNGRNPATEPIRNVMPEILTLNEAAAADLQGTWTFTPAMRERARILINARGVEEPRKAVRTPNPGGRNWRIAVVNYVESAPVEETLAGMREAWKRSPLVEGRDYTLSYRSAQGDMAALGGIFDAVLTAGADLVVPLTTPSLQVALQKVRTIPVVFSVVANPVVAGAGTSATNHLPMVTGVTVEPPLAEALQMLQTYFPEYRRLGTLFCPTEANSLDVQRAFESECRARGLTLESVAVNGPTELSDAALALMARPIDAVVQISDNLTSVGFNAITRAARQARRPLISLNSTTLPLGAPVSFGRDYNNTGEVTTEVIERVIAGEDPARIPFIVPPKIFFSASPANAAAVGMTLPPALLQAVDRVGP
ncbi:MAG: ABC transporter substrate-binding protein [Verrucomicrobia bacterium]|nr:ABC transporter substrate-binding protein [Verrucomicrobiota bacterium]